MERTAFVLGAVLLAGGSALAADGEALFVENCSACHQKGGIGTPGLAPPLVSDVLKQAAAEKPDYLALVVLNGLSGKIEVNGQAFFSAMPAQPQLADDDLAAIVNYVLRSLNGGEPDTAIDGALVASLREPKVGHAQLRDMRAELK